MYLQQKINKSISGKLKKKGKKLNNLVLQGIMIVKQSTRSVL